MMGSRIQFIIKVYLVLLRVNERTRERDRHHLSYFPSRFTHPVLALGMNKAVLPHWTHLLQIREAGTFRLIVDLYSILSFFSFFPGLIPQFQLVRSFINAANSIGTWWLTDSTGRPGNGRLSAFFLTSAMTHGRYSSPSSNLTTSSKLDI